MNVIAKTLIFLLIGSLPLCAGAVTPDCLLMLGATSPTDSDGVEPVRTAYHRLLDVLGGSLDSRTLREMEKAENPFRLPDAFEAKGELPKHLKTLEAMIEARGWDSPALRAALRLDLGRRAELVIETEARRAEIGRFQWKDTRVQTDKRFSPHAISPDGRWLVVPDIGRDAIQGFTNIPVHVTSLETGTTRTHVYPGHPERRMNGTVAFSPDGKNLLLFNDSHVASAIPFVEGKPQWSQAVSYDQREAKTALRIANTSENPRYAFTGRQLPIRRYDLQTNQVSTAKFDATVLGGEIINSGSVGKSDAAYVRVQKEGNAGSVVTFDFGTGNEPRNVRVVAQWPKFEPVSNLVWTEQNQPITIHKHSLYEWPTPNEPRLLFTFSGDGEGPPHLKKSSVLHTDSNGRLMAATLSTNAQWWVEIFDLKSKKLVGRLQLPDETREARLSPDGDSLILYEPHRITRFNYKRRLFEGK